MNHLRWVGLECLEDRLLLSTTVLSEGFEGVISDVLSVNISQDQTWDGTSQRTRDGTGSGHVAETSTGGETNNDASSIETLLEQAVAVDLLPDLIAWESVTKGYIHGWSIDTTEIPGRTLLRLTTTIANIGSGPLELHGGSINPDNTQDVIQRVHNNEGGFTDRLAGAFVFHLTHGHIHFERFTQYNIRQVTPGNGVGPIVAGGEKTSFCLFDIDVYDLSLPGVPLSPRYIDCDYVLQGISVGWADVYHQSIPDQWIDVTNVPGGQYWLEVVADPDDNLWESDETNNETRILITLEPIGPPQITNILIGGTAWSSAFLDQFEPSGMGGTRGHAFPVGTVSQLDAVSWVNADQLIIRFSEQVNIDQDDLTLTGVNVADYSFGGFTTETGPAGEFQAVWTLTTPLASDKLSIHLDGTMGGAVTDMSGDVLDGEWIDTISTYPSGDDIAGGDFAFRFNVLHSDINGDGLVTLNPDVQDMLHSLGSSIGSGSYLALADLNGDGVITLNPDAQATLNNAGTSLPAGEPSGPSSVTAGSFQPTIVSTTAPMTSDSAEPNVTAAALNRVGAISPRSRAIPRHLDAIGFGPVPATRETQYVEMLDVLDRKRAISLEVSDLAEWDSQGSINLIAKVIPIF